MAFKLADAFARFGLDDGPFQSGLGRINMGLGKVQEGFRKMGRTVAVAMAAVGVGLGFAVKKASDYQEQASKFKAVFKETSDDATAFSETLGAGINRSAAAIRNQMSTFQDVFVPLGWGRDDARKMSQAMTQLTQDLSSFRNESEDDTISALTSSMLGSAKAAIRYGADIKEANLSNQLLKMGIQGGTRAATEQQKVMARLQIIIDANEDAIGDAARTSTEFANTWRGLKGKIADTGAALGSAFLPPLSKAMTYVGQMLNQHILPWIKANGDLIVRIVGISMAVGGAILVLPKLIGLIRLGITTVSLFGKALAFVAASPMALTIGAVVGITAALWMLRDKIKPIGNMFKWLAKMASTAFEFIQLAMTNLAKAWDTAIDAMASGISGVASGISSLIADGLDLLGATESAKAWQKTGKVWKQAGDSLDKVAGKKWGELEEQFTAETGRKLGVGPLVEGAMDGLAEMMGNLMPKVTAAATPDMSKITLPEMPGGTGGTGQKGDKAKGGKGGATFTGLTDMWAKMIGDLDKASAERHRAKLEKATVSTEENTGKAVKELITMNMRLASGIAATAV